MEEITIRNRKELQSVTGWGGGIGCFSMNIRSFISLINAFTFIIIRIFNNLFFIHPFFDPPLWNGCAPGCDRWWGGEETMIGKSKEIIHPSLSLNDLPYRGAGVNALH